MATYEGARCGGRLAPISEAVLGQRLAMVERTLLGIDRQGDVAEQPPAPGQTVVAVVR
jgi:hypothetical protein